MSLGRQILQQKTQKIMHDLTMDPMVVIQNQRGLPGCIADLVDQWDQETLLDIRFLDLSFDEGKPVEFRIDLLQRSQQVAHEADGVVIALVDGKPGGGDVAILDPCSQQRGLAVASRCGDECQAQVGLES